MTPEPAVGVDADALERLVQLRVVAERLLDEFAAASGSTRPASLRKLLLALELRWKLEEQLVLPAVRDAGGASLDLLRAAERESGLLRELSTVARAGSLAPAPHHTLMTALEGLAALRCERIERALEQAQRTSRLDSIALRREMDALLDRWHDEVIASGDIEDEEIDPVGLPPR